MNSNSFAHFQFRGRDYPLCSRLRLDGDSPSSLNWRLLRHNKPSVVELLSAETYRFDFYRAVQILEIIAEKLGNQEPRESLAAQHHFQREPVLFRHHPSPSFPASALHSLLPREAEETHAPILITQFLGLLGPQGALPLPYTELVYERSLRGDKAMQHFLDIFHHRLLSLQYRVRQTHRVGYDHHVPWRSRFARFLFSLIGLGTEGLQKITSIDDQIYLYYTGLLAHQPRSLVGLEAMLSSHFKVPVETDAFVGTWMVLPEEEYSQLGMRLGQNQVLGRGAALGTRAWDQQGCFKLTLGPLDWQAFLNFLPIGWGFTPLKEMTQFFVGQELDFHIHLRLRADQVPACRLGNSRTRSDHGARLGWTTWLHGQPVKDNQEIRLIPRLINNQCSTTTVPLFAYLPQDELDELMERAKTHYYPIHSVVVREGDSGDSLFIINTGSVQITKQKDHQGPSKILTSLYAGDFFGEYSLLTCQPRNATVITTSDAKLLELKRADLLDLFEKYPRIRQTVEDMYQRRREKEK